MKQRLGEKDMEIVHSREELEAARTDAMKSFGESRRWEEPEEKVSEALASA